MCILTGAHNGMRATLLAVDVDSFSATVQLAEVCGLPISALYARLCHTAACLFFMTRVLGESFGRDDEADGMQGPHRGDTLSKMEYENICKLAD